MKAIDEKELRLGNLIRGIYYTEDFEGEVIRHGDICTVIAINDGIQIADHSIYVDSKSDTEIFSSFQGIPLTEEWLLKFGFLNGVLTITHNQIQFTDHAIVRGMTGAVHFNECKYVHQLQNLYFALTGQELTIES